MLIETKEEEWDICPVLKKNFRCFLKNNGLWRLEEKRLANGKKFGKWLCFVEPIGENHVPTFGDQRNFFSCLFEAEWRNDSFIFEDGSARNPQMNKKIKMFKEILDEISMREKSKVERGIDYYLKKGCNGEDKTF